MSVRNTRRPIAAILGALNRKDGLTQLELFVETQYSARTLNAAVNDLKEIGRVRKEEIGLNGSYRVWLIRQ